MLFSGKEKILYFWVKKPDLSFIYICTNFASQKCVEYYSKTVLDFINYSGSCDCLKGISDSLQSIKFHDTVLFFSKICF